MKIAITTTDGKNINEHFGKAEVFHIYDVEDGNMNFVEKRKCKPYCRYGGDTSHGFEEDHFNECFAPIRDCKALFTKQIGQMPQMALEKRGLSVVETDKAIDEILIRG